MAFCYGFLLPFYAGCGVKIIGHTVNGGCTFGHGTGDGVKVVGAVFVGVPAFLKKGFGEKTSIGFA